MDDPNYGFPDEIREHLDKEFRETTERCTRLMLKSRGLEPDAPLPKLFHYTSADAAMEILTSHSLHATHAQFLRDRTEFRNGIDLAGELLSLPTAGTFLRDSKELLDDCLRGSFLEPYVVSFSFDSGNRLSQWMIYGGGGAGFSIGFDHERLSSHFGDFARVLPVTYDPKVHAKILTTGIDHHWEVCERAARKRPDFANKIVGYCRSSLVSLIAVVCTAFKHPGFEEEQEFRLVARRYGRCPEPMFRTGRFGITPYLDLKSPAGQTLPVVKIMQGPTADRESAEKGIGMLLADGPYDGVEIEVSDIPQR